MSRNSYDSTTNTLTQIGGWQSVDNALSSTSHNPVYNSVVTGAVNGIEQSVAPQEDGDTVSQSYAIGEQFYRNNTLYKFKTAVSSGTSWSNLTLNTDYEAADNVTDQLSSVNEALAKQTLYFTSVACAATTGNFATVSNANISADHVVVECTFANPAAITTDVTWTTANGSLTLNGTCVSATTANITLSKKGN